jgi:hypothetical protein
MNRLALLPLALMISACGAQAPRVVLQPYLPPPPTDLNRPVGDPLLPHLDCLEKTAEPCPGDGSSGKPSVAISTATRS